MKRAILCSSLLFSSLTLAVLLIAQTEEERVYVDYRDVMIPTRDGARLETVILTPQNPKGPLPFLIDRTPYGVPAKDVVAKGTPARQRWRSENYISVFQNIRGRFQSEGKFVMFHQPHDPKDPKGVDEKPRTPGTPLNGCSRTSLTTTDAPASPALPTMAGRPSWPRSIRTPRSRPPSNRPSPADQFLGDDFHHNGAFRLSYGFEYSAMLETSTTENYRFHRPRR